MKLCVLVSTVAVLMVCCVPDTQGRPGTEVKPKHKVGAHKKLRLRQWIHWIVSLDDDAGETDALRENLATLTVVPDLTGSSFSGSPLNAMSPISHCIDVCFGNSSNNNVSALHQCNRECMLNPHRFDHAGNGSGESRNSGDDARRRRYRSNLVTLRPPQACKVLGFFFFIVLEIRDVRHIICFQQL